MNIECNYCKQAHFIFDCKEYCLKCYKYGHNYKNCLELYNINNEIINHKCKYGVYDMNKCNGCLFINSFNIHYINNNINTWGCKYHIIELLTSTENIRLYKIKMLYKQYNNMKLEQNILENLRKLNE